MKKYMILLFLLIICSSFNTFATSGPIKQGSIIECNGNYYGNHGNPLHWHMVEKKNDKWISISKEVSIPSCYIKKINEIKKVTLAKCGDGDTARFIIDKEEKKVRFLAIDTPEVDKNELYSKEASEYTCNALKNANEIFLEYDGNSDKEDKYGRILAFVYVDGVLLEKKLIENGLAKVAYIYGDYAHLSDLREMEKIAINNKVGIWSEDNLGDVASAEIKEDNEKIETEDSIILKIINFIMDIIRKIFDLLCN